MRFVADESVDAGIVRALRAEGHEVDFIAEMAPSLPDSEVLALSSRLQALLVTGDKDFGELVYRMRNAHSGVLLIRLYGLDEQIKGAMVAEVIRIHGHELQDAFSVMTSDTLRIRPK